MDSKKPLISIIVPVYNTEKYLSSCIDSLLAQSYSNLEILLIDDGSKDASPQICDSYAKTDSRIKVIHKENAGVSAARNTALDEITGDYVGFVDSDDIVRPDAYEILYDLIIKNNADIAVCKLARFFDGEEEKKLSDKSGDRSEELILSSTDALSDMFIGKHFYGSLCDKLFKAELLRGEHLREDIFLAEDFLFTTNAILKAKKVCFTPKALYFYRTRETSATHTLYREKNLSSYDALVAAEELLKKHGVYDTLRAEADAIAVTCHVKIMLGLYENSALRPKYAKRSVRETRKHLNRSSLALLTRSVKRHAMMICLGQGIYFAAQKVLNPKK